MIETQYTAVCIQPLKVIARCSWEPHRAAERKPGEAPASSAGPAGRRAIGLRSRGLAPAVAQRAHPRQQAEADQHAEQCDLQPGVECHGISLCNGALELLWTDQRVDEVDQQAYAHDGAED